VTDSWERKQWAKLEELRRKTEEMRRQAQRQDDLRYLASAERAVLDGNLSREGFVKLKRQFEDHVVRRDSFRPEDV
jgi:hypothetical protein